MHGKSIEITDIDAVGRLTLADEVMDIADFKNSAPREADASFVAKFLEEFVEDKPWLHLDVAGTCYSEKGDSYYPQGATGQGMRSIYSYLKKSEEIRGRKCLRNTQLKFY